MDANIMRDKGIDKGFVREFDDSKREFRGYSKGFFGFRKMFWTYLQKLHVAFYDECCPALTTLDEGFGYPVRWNVALQRLEFFNGTIWADITQVVETTTTSTSSTTTTTTTV